MIDDVQQTPAHGFGWVRAAEQLRDGPRRLATLTVHGQLVAAGVLVLCAFAAGPRLLALEDLLLAAGLAVSARSTALAARRTVWWDSYPVAQLGAVVVLSLAGVVGAAGPAVSGLAYVLLVLSSAPYLRGLQAVVVVAGCSAGHLAALVLHGTPDRVGQDWLLLTGVLVAIVLMTSAQGADRLALRDLVLLEVTDPVTALPTGRYLEQAGRDVATRGSRSAPIAVVALRVEDLDLLARDHGDDVADLVMARLAGRLRGVLRAGDVLARTAPDEFVALLPHADAVAATEVAARLRSAGAPPDGDVPAPVLVTGVAAAQPRHTHDRVDDLVARARAQRPATARQGAAGQWGDAGGWLYPVEGPTYASSGIRTHSTG